MFTEICKNSQVFYTLFLFRKRQVSIWKSLQKAILKYVELLKAWRLLAWKLLVIASSYIFFNNLLKCNLLLHNCKCIKKENQLFINI